MTLVKRRYGGGERIYSLLSAWRLTKLIGGAHRRWHAGTPDIKTRRQTSSSGGIVCRRHALRRHVGWRYLAPGVVKRWRLWSGALIQTSSFGVVTNQLVKQ